MPSCERCGFYISQRDATCETCGDARITTSGSITASEIERPPVSDTSSSPLTPGITVMWIATAPLMLVMSVLLLEYTDFFSLLGHLIIVLYLSVAFLIDARQVASHSQDWCPNLYFWAGMSLLNIVTFGLLTFVLAPYYLYRRRRLVVG